MHPRPSAAQVGPARHPTGPYVSPEATVGPQAEGLVAALAGEEHPARRQPDHGDQGMGRRGPDQSEPVEDADRLVAQQVEVRAGPDDLPSVDADGPDDLLLPGALVAGRVIVPPGGDGNRFIERFEPGHVQEHGQQCRRVTTAGECDHTGWGGQQGGGHLPQGGDGVDLAVGGEGWAVGLSDDQAGGHLELGEPIRVG